MGTKYCGRFAPSPTGFLHLGNIWVALISYCAARQAGGTWLLRMEDIDTQRCREEWVAAITADLCELGLHPDEVTARQQERTDRYRDIMTAWRAAGLLYPCSCNRARLQEIASAPHPGETVFSYDGHCRFHPPSVFTRPPSWRYAGKDCIVRYVEHGQAEEQVRALQRYRDDIVVQRGDGMYNYQFAVAVDDADMGITEVVRGNDLANSTSLQVRFIRELGASVPSYFHVPLLVDGKGRRLSKRQRGITWREYRAAGKSAEELLGDVLFYAGVNPQRAPRTVADAVAIPLCEWQLNRSSVQVENAI